MIYHYCTCMCVYGCMAFVTTMVIWANFKINLSRSIGGVRLVVKHATAAQFAHLTAWRQDRVLSRWCTFARSQPVVLRHQDATYTNVAQEYLSILACSLFAANFIMVSSRKTNFIIFQVSRNPFSRRSQFAGFCVTSLLLGITQNISPWFISFSAC